MASDIVLNDDGTVTISGGLRVLSPALFPPDATPRFAMLQGPDDTLIVNLYGNYGGGLLVQGSVDMEDGLNVEGGASVAGGLKVVGGISLFVAPKSSGGSFAGVKATEGSVVGVFGGGSTFTGKPVLPPAVFNALAEDLTTVDLVEEIRRLRTAIQRLREAVTYLLDMAP